MRWKIPGFLLPCFFCFSLSAQSLDSLSFRAGQKSQYVPPVQPAPVFSARIFILPALMIGYGVLAQNNDGITDLNEGIHRIIWTSNPHSTTHIDNYLQWTPAVAVYALNLAGVKGKHNLLDRSVIFAMAEIIQSSTVYGLKKIGKETRPNGQGTESFPSGHSSNAFAGAEFLRREYKDLSPWYAVGGYVAAAATGYLRMYNNKHWFGDIVAGAGIGILSTDLAYALYPVVRRLFRKKMQSSMLMPTLQNGVAGISFTRVF